MKLRKSIAYRLALITLLLAFVLGGCLGALQVHNDYLLQQHEQEKDISRLLQVTRNTAQHAVLTLDRHLAAEVISGLMTYDFVVKVQITDESGMTLAAGSQTPPRTLLFRLVHFFQEPLKNYTIDLKGENSATKLAGNLLVQVDRYQALVPFLERVGWVFGSGVIRYSLLVLVLFVVFHSQLTRPLNRLVARIDAADPADPDNNYVRIPSRHTDDELGRIALAINRSFAEVGALMAEKQRQQAELLESERHKHLVIDSVPQVIFARDAEGRFMFVNQAAAEHFGLPVAALEGQRLQDLSVKLTTDEITESLHEDQQVLASDHESYVDDVCYHDAQGRVRIWLVHRQPIDFYGKRIVMVVASDVTEQKMIQQQIRHQAYHDSLTDLPNRTLLLETLSRELDRSRRHGYCGAVLFIDLDHFKKINDSLGHPVGDLVLQTVSQRLGSACRGEDTIARLGGDEFVIVLPELDTRLEDAASKAMDVAEKIRLLVSQPIAVQDQWLNLTCSIGIAMFPEENVDVHAILRYADTAMYHAKDEGRDAIEFFSETMAAMVNRHLVLENQLRTAIEQEQFVMYFQPQVDCVNNRIIGAELLLRWQHPGMGLVSPAEFIPILESSKLIVPVGLWLMRAAFTQVNRWVETGVWQPGWKLGINISPRQFRDKMFVEDVKTILQKTGVSPLMIEFEITEGIVIHSLDEAVIVMQKLRDLGISFSLDDFGTGYSSLGYLKVLPVDTIKIDRSFVRDMCDDPHDAAIVDATLALSRRIGLAVIAEGVEEEEQLTQLKQLRCRSYQGYLYSRPVPASQFEALAVRARELATSQATH